MSGKNESTLPDSTEDLINYIRDKLNLLENGAPPKEKEEKPQPLFTSFDLEGLAEYIKSGKAKKIIVMAGAGISVAAGIPDFRTPGSGLYYQLEKYNLPRAESIFEINYFQEKPEPFCLLAKELFPGNFKPTRVHYFVRLLAEKGLLLRHYTQNIDTLERVAGVPDEKLVEAHGSFSDAHCISCGKQHDINDVRDILLTGEVPRCKSCKSLVKPDIVFFGESLPDRFFELRGQDFRQCDLLIVMGTSLTVNPFAGLVNYVGDDVPRFLINREKAGRFDFEKKYRDACHTGDLEESIQRLAELLGYDEELNKLMEEADKQFANNTSTATTASTSASSDATATANEDSKEDGDNTAPVSTSAQTSGNSSENSEVTLEKPTETSD